MPDGQIIVTGASRGIGTAIALDLAGRGYAVVGLSRSGDVAAGRGIACDVTSETAIRVCFAKIAPEEVARLIGAILDERIPFLTGETIYLDGGQGINH